MGKIDINKISELCRMYRNVNNLTQKEFAEKLQINDQMYAKIERAQHLPKLEQLEHILKITNKEFTDILLEENNNDFFVALKGKAETDSEKAVFDKLIDMILCLDKHKNLYESNNTEK